MKRMQSAVAIVSLLGAFGCEVASSEDLEIGTLEPAGLGTAPIDGEPGEDEPGEDEPGEDEPEGQDVGGAQPQPGASEPTASISITDTWTETHDAGDPEPTLSVNQTTDVVLYMHFAGRGEGVHSAWLTLTTPSGGTYSEDPVAFEIGDQEAEAVLLPDYWAGVPVQTPDILPGGARLYTLVPIAGTNIQTYGLTGTWTATLRAKQGGEVLATRTFELNP